MRVAIAAVLLAGTFYACSDNTPATPATEDAGSTNDDDGGGNNPPLDASQLEDGGQPPGDGEHIAPNGCRLQSTGFKSGKKADIVPRADAPGAINWTNPNGALAEDGNFASVTLGDGQQSSSLRVSDFGFTVPDIAETWGIEVELKRRAPDGGLADAKIEVEIEGVVSRFKYVDGPWPTSIVGTHPYGQAVDTWGVDLYPRHVNAKTFAAKVSVKRTPNLPGRVTGIVDALRVAIWYCPNPPKKQ